MLTWSFAVTTANPSVLDLSGSNEPAIAGFVNLAHQNNVLAAISIGGWSGSTYYSSNVGTAANRTTFVQAVLNLVSTYNLDGVDFDWEYPNKAGIGCNTISSSDSANFLLFLQELRAQPAAKNLILSAATSITPFAGPTGTPMTDVSAFASVLSHIAIMNYDINGQWSTTGVGPNAPLYDSCSTVQAGSAAFAVAAWTGAKFPANQILLGVPAYGHSFSVSPSAAVTSPGVLASYPPFTKNTTVVGTDQCGNPVVAPDTFDFSALVQQGYLTSAGSPSSGIDYRYDTCSQTPYIYNPSTQLMVSYDNAQSFVAKGQFIVNNTLAGFAMWDATGDYNDILLNAITQGLGVVGNFC